MKVYPLREMLNVRIKIVINICYTHTRYHKNKIAIRLSNMMVTGEIRH